MPRGKMHHAPGATLRVVERASECNQFAAFYSLRGGKRYGPKKRRKRFGQIGDHQYRELRNRTKVPDFRFSSSNQCTVQQLYALRSVCGTKEKPGTFTAPLAPRRSGEWWGSPRLRPLSTYINHLGSEEPFFATPHLLVCEPNDTANSSRFGAYDIGQVVISRINSR